MAGLLQDSTTIAGDDGDDELVAGEGSFVIHGGAGDDTIDGRGGADTLIGGTGADVLAGAAGRDVLYGGAGDDELIFDAAADRDGFGDRLFGGDGVDTLRLEFTLDAYTDDVAAEILAFFQALSAGEDPGAGGEFVFETFPLRVAGVEAVRLFVDGVEITPGDSPSGAARDDAFSMAASDILEEDVAANDGPVAGGAFSLVETVSRGSLVFNQDGTFAYDPESAFLALSAGEVETETFVYQFDDGAGGSTTASVTITIEGENEAPFADDVRTSTDEDSAISLNLVIGSEAFDNDRLDVLSLIAIEGVGVADDVRTFTIGSGALIRLFPDGMVDYDPLGAFDELPEGASATDEFEFTIGDGRGGEVDRVVTVRIDGVNDAPITIDDVVFVSEGGSVEFEPAANDFDVEGDAVSLIDFDDPSGLTFREGRFLIFEAFEDFEFLNAGDTAEIEIAYTVSDTFDATSTGLITVVVEGENDEPIVAPLSASTDETVASFTFDLLTGQEDIDQGSTLSIENLVEIDTSFGGSLVGSTFTFTPTTLGFLDPGETRTISYSFDVVDDQGARVASTFELTVAGVDGAFAAADDLFETTEDEGFSGDVSLNDNAPAGATFSLISATGSGLFNFRADGTFDFDPDGRFDQLTDGELETFEFEYRITDGARTTEATARIDIEGLNDGPAAILPQVIGVEAASLIPSGADGGEADSRLPFISADGADIVFASAADDLTTRDDEGVADVFLRDLSLDQTDRVSAGGDGASDRPSLTADGRVLFLSDAQNLDGPVQVNGAYLIAPDDADATNVSVNSAGEAANGAVETPSISADGRFVTFTSAATNLDDDDINGAVRDVFLRDLETGDTRLISQFSGDDTGASFDAKISADGSTVVFHTENALVGGDLNGVVDVYALDLETGSIDLISQNGAGEVGDAQSVFSADESSVSVSANGRYVAFSSLASNLAPLGDTNGVHDVFVRDRFEGRTELISVNLFGAQADGLSSAPVISADGRFVAFQTAATNLDVVFADTNDITDVYVFDRVTEETIRASADFTFGSFQQPGGFQPTISADGRFIGFVSDNNLGQFETPVRTSEINQVFVTEIAINGFTFTDDDGESFIDFAKDIIDPEFDDLTISNVSIVSDNSDRIVDVEFDEVGASGEFSPLVGIDLSQFDGLGENDYEILTATYDITDGVDTSTNTIGIVVQGRNDAPIVDGEAFDAVAGQAFSGAISAFDPEFDEVTFSLVGAPPVQNFTLNPDGSFALTANGGEVGINTFTVAADDGEGGVTEVEITVIVGSSVNRAPEFTPITGAAVAVSNAPVAIDLSALFVDPDGDALTFSASQTSGDAIFALTLDAATGVLGGTHDAERLDRIEITATDGDGAATTGEIWLAYVDDAVIDGADGTQLSGALASTYFDGGPGGDLIFAGAGFDVFAYDFTEDGFDQIEDETAGQDGFVLIDGAMDGDLSFTRLGVGDDLLITLAGEETTFDRGVLFSDALGANRFSGVGFADGTIVTTDEIRAEVLFGEATDGDDLIQGFFSEDVLAAGAGNDTLRGRDGADTYRITPDGGTDLIEDNGFFDRDLVEITTSSAAVTFRRGPSENDLSIGFDGGGGVIVLNTLNGAATDQIETFAFTDGSLSIGDIRQRLVDEQQTEGDDVVTAFGVNDGESLDGGAGDDTLFGLEGDDVYIYRRGGGDDVIRDGGLFGADELQIFGFRLDTDSLDGLVLESSPTQFRRAEDEPNDLMILFDDGSVQGSVRIVDGLSGSVANTIETISFPDFGISITPDLIRRDLISQQRREGETEIVGFEGVDEIDFTTETEIASGGAGGDVYIYSAGDGAITIDDDGFFNNDRVILRDLDFTQVSFEAGEAAGRDLVIRSIAGPGDVLRVLNGLDDDSRDTIELFEDATGAVLTRSEVQTLITAAEAASGRGFVSGGFEADTLPTTVDQDAVVEGRDGADIFTYQFRDSAGNRVGDGSDIFIDSGFGDIDQVVIEGLTEADVVSGAVTISFDDLRDEVRFDFGEGDALTIVGARDNGGAFGRIVFDDVIFDDNDVAADGRPSFADFVAEQGQRSVEIAGTGDDDVLESTAGGPVDEAFLPVGGSDVVRLIATEIGDDVIARGNVTTDLQVDIDFGQLAAGASAGQLFFSRAVGAPDDLQIVVFSSLAVAAPVVERVVIQDALLGVGNLDLVRILDNGDVVEELTRDEIGQIVTDQQATLDDDLITPTAFDDVIIAGPGDDVIESSAGNDVFEFFDGDGRDLIRERQAGHGTNDTLRINDFAPVDMTLRLSPTIDDGLVLDFGDDEITLEYGLGAFDFGVDFISFEDTGDLFTREVLIQRFVSQQIENDAASLIGGDFADVLIAGDGTLFMSGQGGDDVYRLSPTAPQNLTIRDNGGGDDVVELGADAADVTFRVSALDPTDLLIDYASGLTVTIDNTNQNGVLNGIESYVFADGTGLTRAEARALALANGATGGDDGVTGTLFDDVLTGGEGSDTLRGANGSDRYVYTVGEGDDVIIEEGVGGTDVLVINGATEAQTTFSRDLREEGANGDDLVLTFASGAGSVRVLSTLRETGDNSIIEQIEFADSGATITIDEARQRATDGLAGASSSRVLGLVGVDDVIEASADETVVDGQSGNDTFVFAAGSGLLVINDSALATNPAVTHSLRIDGAPAGDATLRRLAEDSEHFIVTFDGSADRIVVLGERFIDEVALGVETIEFTQDGVILSEADITARLNGFAPVSRRDAPPVAEGVAETTPEAAGLALIGGSAAETFTGGDGDDVIRAGGGADTLFGGAGDDLLAGQGASDIIMGEAGDDRLNGGVGSDELNGGAGADEVIGNRGADLLFGAGGLDTMRGGGGDDALLGGGGGDLLFGGGGRDVIFGDGGADEILGRRDADDIAGGRGADTIGGGQGADTLSGGAGADELRGGRGADDLSGGAGADVLSGNAGADVLRGDLGADLLSGGTGADVFVFRDGFAAIGEEDVVRDFEIGLDRIDLSGLSAVGGLGDLSLVQVANDTLIFAEAAPTVGTTPAVRLLGVTADDLSGGDFIF